jgi:anti-anti-sigma regulatory factor/anti-sigma regulatory factor (Ser/Thr protein kinase)
MASVLSVAHGTGTDEADGLDRERTGHGYPAGPDAKTSGPAHGYLTCVAESRGPDALVLLAGQLDLTTAVEARTVLHKALAVQPGAIVVDLSGLTADDDVVLTLFSAFARTAAEWPGCPVLLCGADPRLREALDRMAVSRIVPLYPDQAGAFAAAGAGPAPRRYRQRLATSPHAAATARQLVDVACRAWQLPALVEDARLVVTELVSNALRHAGGDLELAIVLRQHFLHLAVRDGSTEPPKLTLSAPDTGEGGRGLFLVDAVAAGWGSTPTPDGKHVWATLRIPR